MGALLSLKRAQNLAYEKLWAWSYSLDDHLNKIIFICHMLGLHNLGALLLPFAWVLFLNFLFFFLYFLNQELVQAFA